MNHTPHRLLALFAALVLAWTGCRQGPTRWELEVALPVVDATWGWNDVLGDTLGEVAAGNPGVLKFEGEVGRVALDELAYLPDTLVENILTPAFVGGPFEVPPGAVLLDEQQDIVFQGIEQEFTSMLLEAGTILYEVRSKTDGYVRIRYDFPSVTLGGAPVVLEVVLPPSEGGEGQTATGAIDLASAHIDFTGASGDEVNRINSNLLIGTPEEIDYTAQVYGTDSIEVRMLFTGLEVREISGYFGQIHVGLNETASLFDADRFPTGVVSAQPTRADLTLHNTLGADLAFWVEALEFDGVPVGHPQMGQEQVLTRADWSTDPPVVDTWELDVLGCTPDLFEVVGTLPEAVALEGGLQLNPLGNVTASNDFLRASDLPYLTLDLELPLMIGVEGLVIRDTLVLEPQSLPGFEGVARLRLAHDFPVEWVFWARFVAANGEAGAAWEDYLPIGTQEVEWDLPLSTEQLKHGGRIPLELMMHTDGQTPFTGGESVRVQLALEGTVEMQAE